MFTPATKANAKLRAALFGPSGSGKTFSALRMATGIGGKIAVIDTERGSARKYADRFKFDVCELADRTIAGYLAAFHAAAKAGASVLVIDSMSHAWDELLSQIDKLTSTKYSGNSMRAWAEGTPKQRALVDGLLAFPGHIIATMRSDTDWIITEDSRGKMKPQKVGLKPRQGKGIEYEFDLLIEIAADHVATVTKDRTGKYQDVTIEKPDEQFGKDLAAWLSEGETITPKESSLPKLMAAIEQFKINDQTIMGWYAHFNVTALESLTEDQIQKLIAAVTKKYAA